MSKFRVQVQYADGDNWTAPYQWSEFEVEADSKLDAKLLAEQMAYTPQPGKPSHIQITGTITEPV